MSSTNKTTNYELSQFIETDRPAWLTDYNGDMRTIDSTMKAISDVASGASGSISELADRMSTAEGNITTNANDIDALEARADSLEAQAQSTAGTIANIQTEQTAQNLGIEAATELGYNLARPYDSASTYAVGDYVLFQNTLYKCVTAVPVGEVFVPAKWLAIKVMDEMPEGGIVHTLTDVIPLMSNISCRANSTTTTVTSNIFSNAHSILNINGVRILYLDCYVPFTHTGTVDFNYINVGADIDLPADLIPYSPYPYTDNGYTGIGNFEIIVGTSPIPVSTSNVFLRLENNVWKIFFQVKTVSSQSVAAGTSLSLQGRLYVIY